MTSASCDRFYTYEEIETLVKAARDAHPDICTLEALSTTEGGRTIWGITLAEGTDDPASRPGFYVQGGLHAEEGMGITECLVLLYTLLENEDARKILSRITVYILPCINPDGCDACVTQGLSIRSQLESLPAGTPNTLIPQDLDGDGRILSMRWEDPTGMWKNAPGCSSLMVRREPGDTDGPFYQIATEGIIENSDGSGAYKNPRSLDMNRQFAAGWADNAPGGDYPGRHAESRTVMEFLLTHPNIFAAFDIHCGTSALIYDAPSGKADADLLKKIVNLGGEITGIVPITESNYGQYGGSTAPTVLPGVFRGYAQSTFGIPAVTVELGNGWNSLGMSSKDIFAAPDLMCAELVAKLIDLHEKNGSQIAAPWVKYNHPQLGEVEIGGRIHGNAYFMLASDMNELLPKITTFLTMIMDWYPKLELVNVECRSLGGDVVRVRADVINTGLMNTMPIRSASGYHAQSITYVTLEGAEECFNRWPTNEIGSLAPLESRKLEWFVRAKPGTALTVRAACAKAVGACITVTAD